MNTEESKKATRKKKILTLALSGAAGFGLGGIISGTLVALDEPMLGFPIFGAIGGASLGLYFGGWRIAVILALACATGFVVGFLMAFFVTLAIWGPPGQVEGLFRGTVGGACGDASLGLTNREWGKAGLLAVIGAIGFSTAAQFDWDLLHV